MEQDSIDEALGGLEERFARYMAQYTPAATDGSTHCDSLSLDANEAQISDAMSDIEVTGSFCSICHAMFDNWPDLESRSAEREFVKTEGTTGTRRTMRPRSPSTDGHPGYWFKYQRRIACVVPCQGHTVRLYVATAKGCRCCGLILQSLKDTGLLSTYTSIETRLHRLGKDSKIVLMVCGGLSNINFLKLGLPREPVGASHDYEDMDFPMTLHAYPRTAKGKLNVFTIPRCQFSNVRTST